MVYIDMKTGEEYEQPADLVVLSCLSVQQHAAAAARRHRRALRSRDRQGRGRQELLLPVQGGRAAFFEDASSIPSWAAGVIAAAIDDFNGDNFDHAVSASSAAAIISPAVSGGRPIQGRAVPPGTPRWGSAWKQATAKWYNHCFPDSTRRAQSTPTATIIWISIRPTRTRSAGRWCA